MPGEVQVSYFPGANLYFLFRNGEGQVWSVSGGSYGTYASASYSGYTLPLAQQASGGYYTGTVPGLAPAGTLNVVAKQRLGATRAESDPTIAFGQINWGGSGVGVKAFSQAATRRQVSGLLPMLMPRGQEVRHLPLYFRSTADHVTPFTSGVVSGQVARDGGLFGPLQSGKIVEKGNGFYSLQALTSGDLDGEFVSLYFTCVGVSGGSAEPLAFLFPTQRTSGYPLTVGASGVASGNFLLDGLGNFLTDGLGNMLTGGA